MGKKPKSGSLGCEVILQYLELAHNELSSFVLIGEDTMVIMRDLRHIIKAAFLGYINYPVPPFSREYILWPQALKYYYRLENKADMNLWLIRNIERRHHSQDLINQLGRSHATPYPEIYHSCFISSTPVKLVRTSLHQYITSENSMLHPRPIQLSLNLHFTPLLTKGGRTSHLIRDVYIGCRRLWTKETIGGLIQNKICISHLSLCYWSPPNFQQL